MKIRVGGDLAADDAVEIRSDFWALALLQVVADLALLGHLRAVFDGCAGKQILDRLRRGRFLTARLRRLFFLHGNLVTRLRHNRRSEQRPRGDMNDKKHEARAEEGTKDLVDFERMHQATAPYR